MDWGKNEGNQVAGLLAAGVAYYPEQWGCDSGMASVNVAATTQFAQQYPGSHWLAFNEPENPGQANCSVEAAADAYYLLYNTIKAADATAKVYCCGTEANSWGMNWMEGFRQAWLSKYGDGSSGGPPIDGTHIHLYPYINLSGYVITHGPYDVQPLIDEANNYMATALTWWHTWPHTAPVIVSEWGILGDWNCDPSVWWEKPPYTDVANYYIAAQQWLNERTWVESSLWFSSWNSPWYGPSNLWASTGYYDKWRKWACIHAPTAKASTWSLVGKTWHDHHLDGQ